MTPTQALTEAPYEPTPEKLQQMEATRNKAKRSIKMLNLLQKPMTTKIIEALHDSPMNVTQLMIRLRYYTDNELSQRLAKMRDCDIVSVDREGKNMIYTLNVERIKRVKVLVENFE